MAAKTFLSFWALMLVYDDLKTVQQISFIFFSPKGAFFKISVLTRGVKNEILGPNNYLFQLKKRILKSVNALSKMVKNCLSYRVFHVTIADADI